VASVDYGDEEQVVPPVVVDNENAAVIQENAEPAVFLDPDDGEGPREIRLPVVAVQPPERRRSERVRKAPSRLDGYVSGSEFDEAAYSEELCFMSDLITPTTVREALQSEQGLSWKSAMDEEYASLLDNETWVLEQLPQRRHPVGGKWTYRIKMNSSGEVARFKARYVAK
jgi:hypothetical protein